MKVTRNRNYPSQIADQYMLRFPDGMRKHVKSQAKENGRTMNAEIIYRLEQAYRATAQIDACK